MMSLSRPSSLQGPQSIEGGVQPSQQVPATQEPTTPAAADQNQRWDGECAESLELCSAGLSGAPDQAEVSVSSPVLLCVPFFG